MAANACVLESDGSPFLVPGERILGVQNGGFLAVAGSGYPGQTCSYQDADCILFISNVRVVVRPQHPTLQFSSFAMPMWLITDEKLVEPRFGPVRIEGRVVPIPGLGLPARARFEIRFPNRASADEFMRVFDVVIETARCCQVAGGPDAAAHHSVCAGPDQDAAPVGFVQLGSDRALMDPNDPSTIMLPPSYGDDHHPAVGAADVSLSVSEREAPVRLGTPDRNGYQRILDRHA